MGPTNTRDVADTAFDKWLRMGLRVHYDAVVKMPVPRNLMRLIQGREDADWMAPAPPPRPQDAERNGPAFGLVLAVVLSGLLWAGIALAVRALWG